MGTSEKAGRFLESAGGWVLCTRRGWARQTAFPPKLGPAASLTLGLAGLRLAAYRECLPGRLTPPLPDWSVGTGRPERPGGRGGAPWPTGDPDTLTRGARWILSGPSGGGAGAREGLRDLRRRGRRRGAPPHAPLAANQRAPRAGRGVASSRGRRLVGAVEGSRHCCWRDCGTKFLAG